MEVTVQIYNPAMAESIDCSHQLHGKGNSLPQLVSPRLYHLRCKSPPECVWLCQTACTSVTPSPTPKRYQPFKRLDLRSLHVVKPTGSQLSTSPHRHNPLFINARTVRQFPSLSLRPLSQAGRIPNPPSAQIHEDPTESAVRSLTGKHAVYASSHVLPRLAGSPCERFIHTALSVPGR